MNSETDADLRYTENPLHHMEKLFKFDCQLSFLFIGRHDWSSSKRKNGAFRIAVRRDQIAQGNQAYTSLSICYFTLGESPESPRWVQLSQKER